METLADCIKVIDNIIDEHKYKYINCNRTNLNKIIKWTSSKYNEMTKDEAITDILYRTNMNDNLVWRYNCGSFAEGNHNRGYEYILVCRQGEYFILCVYSNDNKILYKLRGV